MPLRKHAVAGRIAAACCALAATAAVAQEWTRFRGPDGAGHAKADPNAIPVQWTEADYNWKVKLPGTGHGSPVLWGERIFLMCCDERTAARMVVCLSAANGGSLWTRTYKSQPFGMNRDNSFAGTTPAVDKDRLYAAWATPKQITLVALDHDGKELWQRDLGPHRSQHGPCTSPIVFEDMVILPNDQQGESFLIAVDCATGKTRWKLPRTSGRAAYSTPCVYRPAGGQAQLILTSTAGGITGVDPKTGQVIWDRGEVMPERCVGCPVVAGDLVVAASGTGGRGKLVAVRPTAGRQAEIAYKLDPGPYVPTPLVRGDLIFLLGDLGAVSCLRAATGREVWKDKLPDRFYGSFVLVGQRLYCISRTGKAYVLAAGEQFKLLATNSLPERSFATPAVAGGRMYLRTYSHLISIGGKG
jgi:outer membrane protein assembly factor BamB